MNAEQKVAVFKELSDQAVEFFAKRLRKKGLLGPQDAVEGIFTIVRFEDVADCPQLAGGQAGGTETRFDAPLSINPAQALQLRVLIDDDLGPTNKLLAIEIPVGNFTGDPHQLFLAFQQAQAKTLLRVFHVAFDGFLFPVHFFQVQISKGGCDGG